MDKSKILNWAFRYKNQLVSWNYGGKGRETVFTKAAAVQNFSQIFGMFSEPSFIISNCHTQDTHINLDTVVYIFGVKSVHYSASSNGYFWKEVA